MSRHVLIDGDVLVYESSFGAQRNRYTVYVDGGDTRSFNNAKERDAWLKPLGLQPEAYRVEKHLDVLDEHAALAICRNKLTALCEKLKADSYHLYLTGKGNFREEVATLAPYKGNRADVEKPVHFAACRGWFENDKHCTVTVGQEADDAIGIASYAHWESQASTTTIIIASIDKDLRQLPGNHYEWHTEAKFRISEDAADRWFWLQMLMGDKADNIPGIKGLGDVKAAKLLDGMGTRQHRADQVTLQYIKQYGEQWKPWADEVGALLWIRRKPGQVWSLDAYMGGKL